MRVRERPSIREQSSEQRGNRGKRRRGGQEMCVRMQDSERAKETSGDQTRSQKQWKREREAEAVAAKEDEESGHHVRGSDLSLSLAFLIM